MRALIRLGFNRMPFRGFACCESLVSVTMTGSF
jgi:hypothetical protein